MDRSEWPTSRWLAVVTYRTDSGQIDVEHHIEEIEELAYLIERGPDWNAVVDIKITLQRVTNDGLTVEAAALH